MSWRKPSRRGRMDIVRGILLVGWTAAVALYFTAGAPTANPLGDPLDDSKVYRRTLELYGGTANVVASEITDWVRQLWHGRPLAVTVAVLTLVLAAGYYLVTEDPPPES